MKKKILGLLVALCLIIGLLPMTALAAPATAPAKLYFATHNLGDVTWIDASYPATLTLNPGDVVYYTTEKGVDSSYPDSYYMVPGADANTYNVKFEYANGEVVISLKDANLDSTFGLHYGCTSAPNEASVKVVVEEDSTITTPHVNLCSLSLHTTGDAIITGPGKLTINNCSYISGTWGAITSLYALTIKDANIEINTDYQQHLKISGISVVKEGDLIIDNSKVTINAFEPEVSKIFAGLITVNGGLTIKNYSDVFIVGSPKNGAPYNSLLDINGGEIVIQNSDVLVANPNGGGTEYPVFLGADDSSTGIFVTVEGCTAVAGAKGTYDPETGVFTAPEDVEEVTDETDVTWKQYFQTAHICSGGTATCAAAAVCEHCGEEYGETLPHTGTDDGDCTTAVKCTVCGGDKVAAKAEHAYTDANDTSCNNEGCTKTRVIEAPKPDTDNTSKPGTNGSPQTGDNTNLVALFSLLAVSALGLTSVLVFKKKAI